MSGRLTAGPHCVALRDALRVKVVAGTIIAATRLHSPHIAMLHWKQKKSSL